MAPYRVQIIEVPMATGFSDSANVSGMSDLTLQIGGDGSFDGTVQVQGKLDPDVMWINVGSPIEGFGLLDISAIAPTLSQVRLNVTAYTSGSATAEVAGH